jgi:hypothetical protein
MCCVETVSFSIRVNGNYSDILKPMRGIRQGDPISPYLFLLCGEGFSCMLKYFEAGHLSCGVRVVAPGFLICYLQLYGFYSGSI